MNGHPIQPTRRRARGEAASRARELTLAREAIAMVAGGAAPRVIIAGIRHGEQIMDSARRIALASGVRVKPLPQPGGGGSDLVVEPICE